MDLLGRLASRAVGAPVAGTLRVARSGAEAASADWLDVEETTVASPPSLSATPSRETARPATPAAGSEARSDPSPDRSAPAQAEVRAIHPLSSAEPAAAAIAEPTAPPASPDLPMPARPAPAAPEHSSTARASRPLHSDAADTVQRPAAPARQIAAPAESAGTPRRSDQRSAFDIGRELAAATELSADAEPSAEPAARPSDNLHTLPARPARRAADTAEANTPRVEIAAEHDSAPAEPAVRITIGRLEVRAAPKPAPAPAPTPRRDTRLGLGEYLEQRRGAP